MKTAIYNKVKRVAMLALLSALFAPATQAQEALHLFYKDGGHKRFDITEDLKVEFVKQPYLDFWYGAHNAGDTLYISANAGRTYDYGMVTSNIPWTISTDADWLKARRDKLEQYKQPRGDGMKETAFLLFTEANKTGEMRTATVTITPTGGEAKTLTVMQYPYKLSLEPTEENFGFDAVVSKEVTIAWDDTVYYAYAYPNFDVKVLSKPNWMTFDTLACGATGFTLEDVDKVPDNTRVTNEYLDFGYTVARFYLDKNLTSKSRSGNIIFEGNGETAVLTVTQEGLNETTIMRESQELHQMLYTFGGAVGEGNHNDFGVPSMMLFTDSRGMDLVSDDIGYNWFSMALDYTDIGANKVPTHIYWRTLYYNIKAINRSINEFRPMEDNPYIRSYLAQAYALRAFDYFYLAQMYEHTYVGNEDAPCVPIVTEENMEQEYTDGIPCASVREVYDYILQNLNQAIALLESNTVAYPDKEYISIEAAYGLRARINLVMNRWEEAAADAERVINAGKAHPYTIDEVSRPTFTDINDHAWIWGINTEETDRAVTSGICNWPSHMGSLSYGYASVGAWRKVSKSLFDAIPATDVRKGWFLDENAASPYLSAEQATYAANNGIPAYAQVKFGTYKDELGTSTNANDIPLMRIEEMYFILAEAKAMLGDVAQGAAILNNLIQTYRDPAYYCAASTAEELVEAVWMQRRIELWGEGHSYYDLMRLKKPVDRRGAGFEPHVVYYIPAGDSVRIYAIPSTEIERNPALEQQPEVALPEPVLDTDY